jgi:hypothetical protein
MDAKIRRAQNRDLRLWVRYLDSLRVQCLDFGT